MVAFRSDLAVALEVGDRAAELALRYFERGVSVTTKADDSPVTQADLAVEQQIRQALHDAFPDDGVLGEEFGRSGTADRTWLIDPIDGTRAFVAGTADWRVQMALEIDRIVTLAVVVAPALRTCWWATLGAGAFESPWPRSDSGARTLHVTTTSEVASAAIEAWPLAGEAAMLRHVAVEPISVTPVGVAKGTLDAFVVCCCDPWDHAPWTLIVPEAGGQFTDWTGGHSAHERGGVFSNAELHEALVDLVLR